MKHAVIYLFPLILDIVVSLALFVSRHSFAEQGLGAGLVGAVSILYGAVYIVSSVIMSRLIVPRLARVQMILSIGMVCALLCLMANITSPFVLLAVFGMLPFATCMFFNAYQAFMLHTDTGRGKSLSATVGHYTFAWSIGFALGPVVSSAVKVRLSWSAAFYAAAVLAALTGILALAWRPARREGEGPEPVRPGGAALPGAGWTGLFTALTGWTAIATFWPLRAEILVFSAPVKGAVEFAFAMSQACAAFFICRAVGWYHRPRLLVLPALCGMTGLVLFGVSSGPAGFVSGAVIYGIYTGSAFIYMVYHAMFDTVHAVRRVAVNELTVGAAFMAGPFIATRLLDAAGSVRTALFITAFLVAAGTAVQIRAAVRAGRKGAVNT